MISPLIKANRLDLPVPVLTDQTDALTGIDGSGSLVEQDFQTALQGEVFDFNHNGNIVGREKPVFYLKVSADAV
ncbi:Uncharacterised protein [Neisseria gonorrhoeae]|uniref:Uncharacterized protein n=1 Tax=Neisseria gonorrhoeae TaxID=485 RepID=A0A378VXQ4_NEIGO|nr:Uncharacterised protein [Neisseria gonorrhoeae]